MTKQSWTNAIVTTLAALLAMIHVLFPKLKVDGVTLGLVALAAAPWLAPLIKSIEIPTVGKIELQDVKKQVDEAHGAAESAQRKAEFALASVTVSNGEAAVHELASEDSLLPFLLRSAEKYNKIREEENSGPARTQKMTSIVREMISIANRMPNLEISEYLKSSDGGKRLIAYTYLYDHPQFSCLDDLVSAITEIEDKPFGQYWAILALGQVIEKRKGCVIDFAIVAKLKVFLSRLGPETDRHYELTRILRSLREAA